jgi:hypothetical protein
VAQNHTAIAQIGLQMEQLARITIADGAGSRTA